MQPNLAVHNANNADIMSPWSAYAVNPSEIMHSVHGMCMQVSWVSLYNIDVPHYTYWPGMHTC